jgi:hypothetical protein
LKWNHYLRECCVQFEAFVLIEGGRNPLVSLNAIKPNEYEREFAFDLNSDSMDITPAVYLHIGDMLPLVAGDSMDITPVVYLHIGDMLPLVAGYTKDQRKVSLDIGKSDVSRQQKWGMSVGGVTEELNELEPS